MRLPGPSKPSPRRLPAAYQTYEKSPRPGDDGRGLGGGRRQERSLVSMAPLTARVAAKATRPPTGLVSV